MVVSDALPVQFWPVSIDTYNESEPEGVFPKCFCHPWESTDIIKIQVDLEILDALYLKIYDSDEILLQTLSFSNTIGTVYTVSFAPSTYGLTDDLISLKIFRGTTAIFKSDCLDVKTSWSETVLITYSNSRNFASLNYTSVSPDPEFYIRIPAVFFQERFPEEDEVIELSNSRSIQLNAQVKAQRLLEVGPMPFYMHRKLKLVLKHQFVEIAAQEWVKEEPYEQQESNKKWPFRRALCWLTEKDYIIRNVL